MSSIRVTTSQNIEVEYDLASLGERMVAIFIDWCIQFAYLLLISLVADGINLFNDFEFWMFLLLAPLGFYNLLSEVFLNGQTVGKKVMKIKVMSLEGSDASLGQYLLRWVFRVVDIPATSGICAVLCIALTKNAQRLGDIVAGTTLIKTQPRVSLQETLYVPPAQPEYKVSFPAVEQLSDADMQLVTDVLLSVRRTGNSELALKASEKIEATLGISRGNMYPTEFLTTLLGDYNYLTSKL